MHASFRSCLTAAAVIAVCCAAAAKADPPGRAPEVDMTRALRFGVIGAGSGAGSVTVTPAGGLSCTGAVRCLGDQNAGEFVITGRKDEMVSITLGPATLADAAGHRMTATFAASATTLVLRPGNKKNPFKVGGTLKLSAGQPEGEYAGCFDVIVEYQ